MTNVNGIAYINLKPYEYYKFVLLQNGVIKKTFDMLYLNTSSIILPFGLLEASSYFNWWNGISYGCSVNNATRVISCSVVDSSGKMQEVFLKAYKFNMTGKYSVCNSNSTSSSTTLVCVLPSDNSTYEYSLTSRMCCSTNMYWNLANGIIAGFLGSTVSTFGLNGLWAGLFLVLAMFFIGLFNPTVSIMLGSFGLVLAEFSGLFNHSDGWLGIVITIITIGALLIHRMRT